MANTKSAKAKVREIQNKTEFNKSIKNRYRTFLKKVELNIVNGDKKEAQASLKVAESEIMSAVSKNILSTSISQDIFRFIEQGTELVEIEGGVAENEVGSIALQKAIETGVFNLIEIGIERGYWEYEKLKITKPCDADECINIRG